VLVRTSAGTGFRAPTLIDLYQPRQIGTSEQFTDPAFPGNGAIQVVSITSGMLSLRPEESKQFSLGVALQPLTQLTATFDYFKVKITDPIVTPTALQLVTAFRRGAPGAEKFVTVNGANEVTKVDQTIQNTGSITTDGVDIDMHWRDKLMSGRMDIGFNGTYTRSYDLINAAGELEKSVGSIVRPDGAPLVAAATGVILRWKHNLSFTYTQGPWSGTLTQRYYRGYEMVADLDGNRQFVPNTSTFDLVASYNGFKNTKLSIGVRNLADRDPPLFINNGSQFQSGYDVYQEDPRGRFIYVQASYKFF